VLRDVLDAGVRHIVLGIGGSATTDGGAGILVGLGARMRDERGRDLRPEVRPLASSRGSRRAGSIRGWRTSIC
jgi:glycerate kinase